MKGYSRGFKETPDFFVAYISNVIIYTSHITLNITE